MPRDRRLGPRSSSWGTSSSGALVLVLILGVLILWTLGVPQALFDPGHRSVEVGRSLEGVLKTKTEGSTPGGTGSAGGTGQGGARICLTVAECVSGGGP